MLKCNLQLLFSSVTHIFYSSPWLHGIIGLQSWFSPIYNRTVRVMHTTFSIQVLPRFHIPLTTREEVTRIESKCSD